jgi:hypothetical protein
VGDGNFDLLQAQRAVFRSSLRSPGKLTALALLDHWSRGGDTFPGIERLATWTSFDRRTVMRTLQDLESQGAIVVTRRSGRPSQYDLRQLALLPPAPDHQCQPITGVSGSPVSADHGDQCQPITPPVSEDHPKEPKKEPTEGTHSTRAPESSPTEGARKRRRRAPEISLPVDWQPTEAHQAYAAKHGLDLDFEADSMRGWAEGKTQVSWNGTFTTRLANQAKWNKQRGSRGRNGAPIVQQRGIIRTGDASWTEGGAK